MLRTLIDEMRIRPVIWRRRISYFWQTRDKEQFFGSLAMLGVPVLAVGSIVWFAWSGRTVVEPSKVDTAQRRAADLRCLAENIYFEARGEPVDGQYAVAEVTLNRARSANFPKTICAVVFDSRWDPSRKRFVAHFSWTSMEDLSEPSGPAWKQAMTVATAVYDDMHMPLVPDALFYHATSVRPYWAHTKKTVAKIGNHIFYR
jgi:spore germination cell wall hydrolase CwlJ-like protein